MTLLYSEVAPDTVVLLWICLSLSFGPQPRSNSSPGFVRFTGLNWGCWHFWSSRFTYYMVTEGINHKWPVLIKYNTSGSNLSAARGCLFVKRIKLTWFVSQLIRTHPSTTILWTSFQFSLSPSAPICGLRLCRVTPATLTPLHTGTTRNRHMTTINQIIKHSSDALCSCSDRFPTDHQTGKVGRPGKYYF